MLLIFSGSGLILSLVRMKPKNFVSFLKKCDFVRFSVRLLSANRRNNSFRCSKCFSCVSEVIRVSSTKIMMCSC